MNIFLLDDDLHKSAHDMVDKHIVKMILEHTQLLSTTYYMTDQEHLAPYKKTHVNHPSAIWARESLDNWLWLHEYTLIMCEEYTRRYGKTHACEEKVLMMDNPDLPHLGLTPLSLVMPDEYKKIGIYFMWRCYDVGYCRT